MNKITVTTIRKQIIPFIKEFHIKSAALFGSFARGESNTKSDIDILVKFSKPMTLIDVISLELKLQKKTGRKIDIVTEKSLDPSIKKYIQKDLKKLV